MSARGGKKRQKSVSRSAKAGVLFPVGRMHRYLKRMTHHFRISAAGPVYQAAVIEYLTGKECLHVYPDGFICRYRGAIAIEVINGSCSTYCLVDLYPYANCNVKQYMQYVYMIYFLFTRNMRNMIHIIPLHDI